MCIAYSNKLWYHVKSLSYLMSKESVLRDMQAGNKYRESTKHWVHNTCVENNAK